MKARFAVLLTAVVLVFGSGAVFAEVAYAQTEAYMGARLAPLSEQEPLIAGCDLGGLAADALRYAAGAELALVPGGVLASDLPQGSVTRVGFEAVFSENSDVWVISVTPAELVSLLETSVSHIETDMETESINRERSAWAGFAQISGFSFRYDATAPVGSRLYRLETEDGEVLDPSDRTSAFSLALPAELMQSLGYTLPQEAQAQGFGLVDALERYITDCGTSIAEVSYDRITAIGVGDNPIVGAVPRWMLFAALGALAVFFAALRFKPVWKEYHFEGEMK